VWHGAPAIAAGGSYDWVFPNFIVTAMPAGLRGLMMASILAVAMSNLSGSLNSLAASSVVDFRNLRGGGKAIDEESQARLLRLSRGMTLVWGMVLLFLGTMRWGPLLEAGLTIASITFGSLLGVFLLGFLVRRANAAGALAGMIAGLAGMFVIHKEKLLVWTWYVLAGAVITFAVGVIVSMAVPRGELYE